MPGPKFRRPILHVDLIDTQGEQKLASVAVHADGRRVGTFPIWGAAWSPDGEWFAYTASSGLGVMNLRGEGRTLVAEAASDPVTWDPIWAPDGTRLAYLSTIEGKDFASTTHSIVIISVADGQVKSRHRLQEGTVEGVFPGLPVAMGPPSGFRWSPDGRRILVAWSHTLVLDTESGAFEAVSGRPTVAEWSPQSDGVYYLEVLGHDSPRDVRLGGFYFKALGSGRVLTLLDGRGLAAFGMRLAPFVYGAMALSPSGSRLALVSGSTTKCCSVLHIYDLEPSRRVVPRQPWISVWTEKTVTAVEWAPDETRLAAVAVGLDRRVEIWVMDLATRAWKTVGTVQLGSEEEVDALIPRRLLSWSR